MWLGQGAAQLGVAGTEVTEDQMKALFGHGMHPDGQSELGASYPSYADLAPYADRVASRVDVNGRPPSAAERNKIAAIEARRGRRAVAGFDLVFTPVKSASVLWALGGPEVRQLVEDAHHEAVHSTLAWLEEHAAYTRTGRAGVAQIDTTGLVCAAFDHRESRSGDPELHTHVAVANKVCGVDGKWRSLDARGLYALGVAASERYNTRVEDALTRRLGVGFVERPDGRVGKRPVREIDGVPAELVTHFSLRRAAIEERYAELRRSYRDAHGREPDRATQLQLAQQATLETREGKGPGRTLAEQVEDWTGQARGVIGARRLSALVGDCTTRAVAATEFDEQAVRAAAAAVTRRIAEQRSTWTVWNVYAETERALRPLGFPTPQAREQATRAVVGVATSPALAIRIGETELVAEPAELTRRRDGQSVFIAHGSQRYTTSEVLLAEEALVAAGRSTDGPHLEAVVLEAALAIQQSGSGIVLDPGQWDLVQAFALSPARLAVGIGPAGAGKTTAMRAFADAWQAGGARVVPLATSSKAAQILGSELGLRAENLHKFLYEHHRATQSPTGPGDDWVTLRPGDVVLVDEAGMAGTLQLARLLDLATTAGATIRLLGDPAQLAAVDAGGALQLLEREVGATHLTQLHRFTDPAEGDATLALRRGDPTAVAFYEARDRIRAGVRDTMLETAYDAWAADVRAGKTSVLIACTNDDVAALNARARVDRVLAGAGDWVVTRENARTIGYRRGRWVHNGDAWQVLSIHRDGSLTVRHLDNRGRVRLPAGYVRDSVELGYASTAHRAQGTTTQTAHALVTPEMTREALYASSRGRHGTRWYVATEPGLDLDCDHESAPPATVTEVITAVLARSSAEQSATAAIRETIAEAEALPTLIARYEHALV